MDQRRERLKIFIGSSTEQYKPIVINLSKKLSRNFEVLTWKSVDFFNTSDYILESLVSRATTCDGAIFVFGSDDVLSSRGLQMPVVRGNVLFEYGLFLGLLERKRVFILRESGVSVPSDLEGIVRMDYEIGADNTNGRGIAECAERLGARIESLGYRDILKKDFFGVSEALKGYRARSSEMESSLRKFQDHNLSREPIVFDSQASAMEAYRQGLRRVSERFWTTSFLNSGFWTSSSSPLAYNVDLLRRAEESGRPCDMRRLLLFEKDLSQEVEYIGKRIRMLHRAGRDDDIKQYWWRLQKMKSRHAELTEKGCETRVATLNTERRRLQFGPGHHFRLEDVELAIYDKFRVDFFEGSSDQITGVSIFFTGMENFGTVLSLTVVRFLEMWEEGPYTLFADFFAGVEREYERSIRRVEYISNWIFKYDKKMSREDRRLKDTEFEVSSQGLRLLLGGKLLKSHLDIGTCIGRYPFGLQDLVAIDGRIVGIDINPDCIEYIEFTNEALIEQEKGRFQFILGDFLLRDFRSQDQFELITCMMSTFSYFGYKEEKVVAGANRRVQETLAKIYSLIVPGGIFIVSKWSDDACRDLQLLNIYTAPAKVKLASWTPKTHDFILDLKQAGFIVLDPEEIQRLVIFTCKKPEV